MMKALIKIKKWNIFTISIIVIVGNNKVNSTSKIIKITAIRKNCKENGIRADLLGSNPHSNGLFFSRSEKVFFDLKFKIIIRIIIISQIISLR